MADNEILEEIYRTRAEIARECDDDVGKLFARMREDSAQLKAEGWKFVSLALQPTAPPGLVREDPPAE